MSAPTRIYLILVALIAMVWVVGAYVVGAGARELIYRGDAHYMYQNAHRLPAVLRGRVVLRDRTGAPLEVPPSTLTVSVRAREANGPTAVRKLGPVDANGLFEIGGLPEGDATVAVQLGGGAVVWQADGIVVGRTGVFDARLDPIDLGDILFPFGLHVIGPSGEPVPAGHIVWRSADTTSDDRSYEGDAPIENGVAQFLTTSPAIDVVTLVPGASAELFEGLWGDEEIHLAPGVTALLRPSGTAPSADDWTLRIVLAPVELLPRIEYDEDALFARGALVGKVERGVAALPLARGGRYRLSWWAVPSEGHRFETLRLKGDGDAIEIPAGPGRHVVDVPFPMEEFTRRASSPR